MAIDFMLSSKTNGKTASHGCAHSVTDHFRRGPIGSRLKSCSRVGRFARLLLLALGGLLPLLGRAEDNPFAKAAMESYTGRFHGQEVELRLLPESPKWKGSLLFKAKEYSIDAELKPTGIEGQFREGDEAWPFTALADGDKLFFTAGTFTATLRRQSMPRLEGRWRSQRVLLIFEKGPAEPAGRIEFNGEAYTFTASEKAGDLEGIFKAGDRSFPFRIANEARGLVFNTGGFAEVITPVPNRSTLRVTTVPPAPFSLLRDGNSLAGRDGLYEFTGEQSLSLELRARGYAPARTNFLLPAYEEAAWAVELEKAPLPSLRMSRWTNHLGLVFVPVPGTHVAFSIWDTRVRDYATYAAVTPGVDVSWRKVEYQGARVSDGPDHPVTMVTWEDAQRFCQWLTDNERKSGLISTEQYYRLPTDEEWSKAVGLDKEKGAGPGDKNMRTKGVYPWGTQWPPPKGTGNFADRAGRSRFKDFGYIWSVKDGFATTSPVGSFLPNRYGLYDMSGNVWQWCEDWLDSEHKYHVLRGGSWRTFDAERLFSSHRGTSPDVRDNIEGFRCVLALGDSGF